MGETAAISWAKLLSRPSGFRLAPQCRFRGAVNDLFRGSPNQYQCGMYIWRRLPLLLINGRRCPSLKRHSGEIRNPVSSKSGQRNQRRRPWIPAKAGMTMTTRPGKCSFRLGFGSGNVRKIRDSHPETVVPDWTGMTEWRDQGSRRRGNGVYQSFPGLHGNQIHRRKVNRWNPLERAWPANRPGASR